MVILVFFGLVRGRSLSLGLGHGSLCGFLVTRFSDLILVDLYLPYFESTIQVSNSGI